MATLDILESYLSERRHRWKTLITPMESGKEQRRAVWTSKRRIFNLRLDPWTDQKALEIFDFYDARKGSFESFTFRWNVTYQYVGTGDGGTKIYTVHDPPIVAASEIIRVDEVIQTDPGDYSIVDATGVITFVVNVPNLADIRADYKHDITMRFVQDELGFQEFSLALWRGTLPMIEVI